MKEPDCENLVVRGMLQRGDQIDIAIEDDEERMTQRGNSVHSVLLEKIHPRFLHDDASPSVRVGRG